MITNQALKQDALDSLSGNWGKGVLAVFLFSVISFSIKMLTDSWFGLPAVGEQVTFLETVISTVRDALLDDVLLIPLFIGTTWLFQSFVQSQKPSFSSIFSPYRNFGKFMLTGLLLVIFQTLWSLLLIIPGIMKYYSYSQTFYILRENPDYTPLQAIRASEDKMDGKKKELFLLQLSFIGWALLSILTLLIGFLWLEPYFRTTMASFYELRIKQAST